MQAHSPVLPISPHPAAPYSRYTTNQPLNTGAVLDVAPPPLPMQSIPSPHPPQNLQQQQQQHQPGGRRPQPIGVPPYSATSSFYPHGPPITGPGSRKRLIVACDGNQPPFSTVRY